MLPDSYYFPSCLYQSAVGVAIPGLVGFDLCSPPLSVLLGPGTMLGTAVPKTTVDENRNALFFKEEIGPTPHFWQRAPVDTIEQFGPIYGVTNRSFSCGI